MKDIVLGVAIIGLCVYLVILSQKEPVVITKTVKGKPDTVEVIKTVYIDKEIPVDRIQYITLKDTVEIKDTVLIYTESTFSDSTDNYHLNISAFSLLPVDSFKYNLNFLIKEKTITRVDTMKIERVQEVIDYDYVGLGAGVGFVLGLLVR